MSLIEDFLTNKSTFTLTYYRLLAIIVVAGIIAAGITALVVTTHVDNKYESTLKAESQVFDQKLTGLLLDSCNNQSNVDNAYRILAGNYRPPTSEGPNFDYLSSQIYHILNCEKSLDGNGKVVYLAKRQEQRYITIVRHGHKPVVENGKIVGKESFDKPPDGFNK